MISFDQIKVLVALVSIFAIILLLLPMILFCRLLERTPKNEKETEPDDRWWHAINMSHIVAKTAIILTIIGGLLVFLPLHKIFAVFGLIALLIALVFVLNTVVLAILSISRKADPIPRKRKHSFFKPSFISHPGIPPPGAKKISR
ncbi:MAG: hypothetical protein PHG23_01945 [Candidatus Pacebacteria bacterium]|nr:hypothetical protein [Candidatus Paceibacterota bacterium]